MELRRDARLGRRLVALTGAALVVALLWVLVRGGRSGVIAGHAWAVPSGPDAVQVEVLNGTGKQGLARVGARVLRRRGIDVMLFANADSVIDSTRIIVRRGD
ncbi:MAG: LytR C-terminal domain-containing protein, partial [Gemmatimonadales bacterium]